MSTHTQVATERLILRERTKELLADVLKRPERDQLFFFGYSDPADLQREHDMFEKGLSNWKMEFRWWDILEQGNKIVVGAAGFHSWYTDHSRAELGYNLFEPFRGQGYMTEALTKIINIGFTDMGLNRIEAFVGPGNDPSLRIMERLGFSKEGLLREHYHKNNHTEDSVAYSLLKREYFAL